MADKAAIMRALMEAMGESGKTMSDADRARQRAMDRASMLEAMESGKPMRAPRRSPMAPMKSLRPKARPETIGGMPGGSTRGVNPAENYSPEDLKRLVRGYEKGGRVGEILRGLGEGSDMSVAALLRMIEGAGGGVGSATARAARKAIGMDPRGKGVTRSGRQLNRMGVSEDVIEMLEGTSPGRKAPLQALGLNKGGAVKKRRLANKPRKGCVMSGRGGKFKGVK